MSLIVDNLQNMQGSSDKLKCPVNSYTEWNTLEEVVVGTLNGGVFPSWQQSMSDTMPEDAWQVFQEHGGETFPTGHLQAAQEELDAFAELLQNEGVRVVRPELRSYEKSFETPDWKSDGGLYAGMPRDLLMVAGDAIIEAPMSWRCRYHEVDAFRSIIKKYFREGARWLPAPKPQLTDELWCSAGDRAWTGQDWAITEFEPVFDAADFMRFGDTIVCQRSHVTNQFGIDWLRRALEPEIEIIQIEVNDPHAMHIDASLSPLAAGKLLVNPERFVPNSCFDGWDIRAAPRPTLPSDWPMYFCSSWVSMNVLSLSPDTVVVERHETPLIEELSSWGLRCIPVDFRHVYSFGGSFHCVTLDIRRAGGPTRTLSLGGGS